jgi:hypothetical protein
VPQCGVDLLGVVVQRLFNFVPGHRSCRRSARQLPYVTTYRPLLRNMRLILKITAGVVLAVILLSVGCAVLLTNAAKDLTREQTWKVLVTAPAGKCWSGAFGERTVDGCGSRTVTLRGVVASANAQKTGGGHWRLALSLRGSDGKLADRQVTSAAYGVVSVGS